MKRTIFITSLLVSFCFAPYASAQSADPVAPAVTDVAPPSSYLTSGRFSGQQPDAPTGNANCFDYYRFGSVVTNISPSLARTIPGATMTFSGSITNENAYPVVGLDLYVKIFRKQDDDESVRKNGHHLVAQFVAVKGLNLDGGATKPFSFEWNVPAGAMSGEYMIATYAMTGGAYNLSGLSFTDDVTGATASFAVGGASLGGVFWDKNKVVMNDRPFSFATFISEFNDDAPVVVSAPLMNTTASPKTVNVSWRQYNWDGLREDALVSSKEETITLDAGETQVLSYVATAYKGPVTYVVADVEMLGTHSILDVRFARKDVRQARINFPSLTTFPLIKNEPITIFSCLHTVGHKTLSGGRLELTLSDEKGKLIAKEAYEGGITGAMMGVAKTFTPTKNYNKVTMTATLSRDGIVEDKGSVVYDCSAIDATKCTRDEKSPILGVLLVIMLIACAIIWGMYFKKKGARTPVTLIMLAMVCGTIWWGAHPTVVQADTTSWTSGTFSGQEMMAHPDCVADCWDADVPAWRTNFGPVTPSSPRLWRNGYRDGNWKFRLYAVSRFDGIQATVNYYTDAKRGGSTLVNGVSVLNVGDTIDFTPKFSGTDISWIETGTYSDSPYGQWGVDGQHGCVVADRVLSYYDGDFFGDVALYASLQVTQPTVSLSGVSANLSCTGLSCTVTGAGAVAATVVYAPTAGVIYAASSKTITGIGLAYYYQAGCLSSASPLMDYAKLLAYPSCGLDTENGDIACYNNAANMELEIAVPQKTIPFSFTAVIPDAAPNAPTITGPVVGVVNTSYSFTFTATDPDGDTLHYEIDWDNDGTVDACAPGSCANVTSGTARSASYMWSPPAASHTFRARTTAGGLTSGWTSHTISISLPAGPPAPTLTGPGSVGSGSTWSVVMTAGGTSVDCDMTRTSAPTWSDQSYPSVGTTETITAALGAFIGPGTLTYRARCVDAYGQWSPWSSTVVAVADPVPALSIVPLAGGTIIPNIPVGNSGTFSFAVRNIGETGSVISGTASAFVNPPFACSFGCTYDSPAGGALGLDAGAPAQTVTISFTPTTPGSVVSTIIFPGNAGAEPIVTGIGISPLVFAPTPIDFGQVVITKSKTIKLRISNISVVNIPAFALVLPAGPFTCESGCSSMPIIAGGYRDAVIRFTPVVSGSVTRTMTLSGRTETIDISGNGVPPEWSVIEE